MLVTKLKNNHRLRQALSAAVILLCAVVMLVCYPAFEQKAIQMTEEEYKDEEYLSNMLYPILEGNYILYNDISKETDESEVLRRYGEDDFQYLRKYLDYGIYDKTGELLEGTSKKAYDLWVKISFDEEGKAGSIRVGSTYLDKGNQYWLEKNLINRQSNMEEYGEETISTPSEVTFLYGMTKEDIQSYGNAGYDSKDYRYVSNLSMSGIFYSVFGTLILVTALAGLALPCWKAGEEKKMFRTPIEILAAVVILLLYLVEPLSWLIWLTCHQTGGASLLELTGLYGGNLIVWSLFFGVVFWIFACLRAVFQMKRAYWKERSYIVHFILWLRNGGNRCTQKVKKGAGGIFARGKRFVLKQYQALLHLDFRDKTNQTILKVVLINFVVMLIFSLFWAFGIWMVVLYSIALFVFLRKYFRAIQEQYQEILRSTNQLAEGRLDEPITGDAGIFTPVQEELKKVQAGFKKAVDEEVKSERMKTDLITNVSHDLKTPLTAIITYIDLLKQENDEEKRREYIQILEKKSQRLKVLIEDLFEVSKATSRNVTMNFMDLDIIGLLKQAGLEYDRNFKGADLDVRWKLPEGKIVLCLDSEKTYRIFENLLVNITKYAMPHTRVYIEVKEEKEWVQISMKNISASELNFNTEEITDRFVRGDVSRNTEGSGLGLAIAKSFTELQHGTLKISTEADLFKAEIRFPKNVKEI